MRVIASTGMEYIPTWNRNKKEKDPIKIKYRYLTGPEKDRIMGVVMPEFDENGKQVGRFKLRIDNERLIKTSILSIENLDIYEDGSTIQANAAHICNSPDLANLYTELVNFFLAENRPIDKKKLK